MNEQSSKQAAALRKATVLHDEVNKEHREPNVVIWIAIALGLVVCLPTLCIIAVML